MDKTYYDWKGCMKKEENPKEEPKKGVFLKIRVKMDNRNHVVPDVEHGKVWELMPDILMNPK
jgi:hypothetical protein